MNQRRRLQSSHTSPGFLRGLTVKEKKKIRNREGWREGVPERPCPEASLEARPLSPQTAPRALAPGAFLGLKRSRARCPGFRVSAADRNLGGRPGLVRHSARLPRRGWFTPPTSLHPTPCHRAPHAGQPIHVSSASSQPGHQRGQAGHSSARGTSGSDTLWKEVSRRACSPRQHPLYLHLTPEYPAASQRGWQKKPLDGRFLRSHESTWGGSRKGLSGRRTAARSHP